MGLDEFVEKYGKSLESGIMQEGCISDFFNLVLEMGDNDRKGLLSQLKRLYIHLLKYQYRPHKQSRSWIVTILDASSELREYKSLSKNTWRSISEDMIARAYKNAVESTSVETGIDKRRFPKEIPMEFEINNVIDESFIQLYLSKYAYSYQAKKALGI